jgi:hypothetical protein
MNVGQSRVDNSAYFLAMDSLCGEFHQRHVGGVAWESKEFSGGFVDFLLRRGRRPQCRWISGRDAVRAPPSQN